MKIIDIFKREWPGLAGKMVKWTPCGLGRVRVRLKNHLEVIFTYYDDDSWSLETEKYNRKWRK
jgi:hypothetical protein